MISPMEAEISSHEPVSRTDLLGQYMNNFRFCPELFEIRSRVLTALSHAGFDWFTHFSSVDPIHDLYGIEVCGIRNEDDAIAIFNLLRPMFPPWYNCALHYKDFGIEPGFIASVYRDMPREREHW